ncbi:uncharacterized protein LOC111302604 [Durio zibethinus]|uniref:Uncharacterized protein LOC111302604 n=1 Tax=Durio zibethinus TaxID=66656 RepID=A0A6P5ZP55_DURZI|nr:uncharacterized protein LOC111302604 [Durio zibethinus]
MGSIKKEGLPLIDPSKTAVASAVSNKGAHAALGYMFSAVLLVLFNKAALSSFSFPYGNVITLFQILCSCAFLYAMKRWKIISFTEGEPQSITSNPVTLVPLKTLFHALPLAVSYLLYMLITMESVRGINVPMYTTLRRTTVAFTMIVEYLLTGRKHSLYVVGSVGIIILGAFVAGARDLSFDAYSYSIVFIANICTAIYLASIARIGKSTGLNSFGLMWCNGIVCAPILLFWTSYKGDLEAMMNFPYLYSRGFQVLPFHKIISLTISVSSRYVLQKESAFIVSYLQMHLLIFLLSSQLSVTSVSFSCFGVTHLVYVMHTWFYFFHRLQIAFPWTPFYYCDASLLYHGFPDKLLCILEYNTQFSSDTDNMWQFEVSGFDVLSLEKEILWERGSMLKWGEPSCRSLDHCSMCFSKCQKEILQIISALKTVGENRVASTLMNVHGKNSVFLMLAFSLPLRARYMKVSIELDIVMSPTFLFLLPDECCWPISWVFGVMWMFSQFSIHHTTFIQSDLLHFDSEVTGSSRDKQLLCVTKDKVRVSDPTQTLKWRSLVR